jgi:predicted transcriptional regulator
MRTRFSPSGELLGVLSALANSHRLRIIAALASNRNYVSQLARELQISRPLLHLHLQKLEAANLVKGSLELSDDGKAMKFYEVTDFAVTLTPEAIVRATRTLYDASVGARSRIGERKKS